MSTSQWLVLPLLLTFTASMIPCQLAQSPASAPAPMIPDQLPQSPASAQAPVPALDCTDALLNMSACLTYVEAGGNVTVPEKGCCPGLANLVNTQPVCLCQLLASSTVYGVKIDTTKALMLPTACRVDTPPVSLCAVLGIPVASPMNMAPIPSSGAPEKPAGSSPEVASGTPIAAPPNKSSSPSSRASILAVIISLSIVAIF